MLLEISRAITKIEQIDELLPLIANLIREGLNLDSCLILHRRINQESINVYTDQQFSAVRETQMHLCTFLMQHYHQQLSTGKPLLLFQPQELPPIPEAEDAVCDWQPRLIYPLICKQIYLGAVVFNYLESSCPVWEDQDSELATIETIATQCALALYQEQLQEQFQKSREPRITDGVETNQRKLEYLSHMNHELRAPLSAILGLARMLNEQIYGALNEKQAEYIQAIMASGEHLLALINDFLDLSKIDAQKEELYLEKILIEEVCQASLAIIREKAIRKEIELDLDIESGISFCVADQMRLKQILVNLLSNGVKYTEQGRVTLRVTQEKGNLVFAVIDTGIGISLENQQKLFQPFSQIPNHLNRKQKGTGLGLVLSKKLARLHGGDLTVESTEGKGSSFNLYLPLD